MNYKKYTIFTFLIAFPPLLINFVNVAYANTIDMSNIFSTLFFLLAWMAYGLYSGYRRAKSFLIFNFIFWILNIGIVVIHNNIIDIGIIYMIPTYVSLVPMYGLYYFIKHLINIESRSLGYCLLIISILVFSVIGLIKYKSNHRHQNL